MNFLHAFSVGFLREWSTPLPFAEFSPNTSVIVSGTYALPPHWVGNIYVAVNGTRLRGYIPLPSNANNSATTTAMWGAALPALPEGLYRIELDFAGGESCAVQGTCTRTERNVVYEERYPTRTIYLINYPTQDELRLAQ